MSDQSTYYRSQAETAFEKGDYKTLFDIATRWIKEDDKDPLAPFYCGAAGFGLLLLLEPKTAFKNAESLWENAFARACAANPDDATVCRKLAEMMEKEIDRVYQNATSILLVGLPVDPSKALLVISTFGDIHSGITSLLVGLAIYYRFIMSSYPKEVAQPYSFVNRFYISKKLFLEKTTPLLEKIRILVSRASLTQQYCSILSEYNQSLVAVNMIGSLSLKATETVELFELLIKEYEAYCDFLTKKGFGGLAKPIRDYTISDAKGKLEEAKKNAYWEKNPKEKEALNKEKETLRKSLDKHKKEAKAAKESLDEAIKERDIKTEEETVYSAADQEVQKLIEEKASLGLFQGKQKKALAAQIEEKIKEKQALQIKAEESRQKRNRSFEDRINGLEAENNKKQESLNNAEKRIKEIERKLEKPV